MEKRYEKARVTKKNNKTVFQTSYYSSIPVRDGDTFVITQQGDRLDNLAFQFYGTAELWWYIAKANALKSMNVKPGIQLRIPQDASYARTR
tara:strand:+ start:339 stop:611 length:273 start_codon:yes stop_codon:yes gene_type:complete